MPESGNPVAKRKTTSSLGNALTETATRFGSVAKALGLVTTDDILAALRRQEEQEFDSGSAKRIGDILVEQGKLTADNVAEVLREQEHVERANLESTEQVEGFIAARKSARPVSQAATIEELTRRVEELEQKLVAKDRVEQIAASSALDVLKLYERDIREAVEEMKRFGRALEKREFARKVAESLATLICRRALEEPVADIVHFEFEKAVDARAQQVFDEELKTPKVAKRLREISGASKEVESASRRLARRLDQIEQEALPKRLERMFHEKVEQKLGDVSAEAIASKLDVKLIRRQLVEVAHDAIGDMLVSGELKNMLNDSLLQAAMSNLVNTTEFKSLLDAKFKTMTEYLSREVIPKHLEGKSGKK